MLIKRWSNGGKSIVSLLLLELNLCTSSLITLNKRYFRLSRTVSLLPCSKTFLFESLFLSAPSRWLFALHTFDLTIMVLRISLENTQSMLIESSSHSGSIPYYALDQLHRDGGPGRSMHLTQLVVDSRRHRDWGSHSDPDSEEFPSLLHSFSLAVWWRITRLVVDGSLFTPCVWPCVIACLWVCVILSVFIFASVCLSR